MRGKWSRASRGLDHWVLCSGGLFIDRETTEMCRCKSKFDLVVSSGKTGVGVNLAVEYGQNKIALRDW